MPLKSNHVVADWISRGYYSQLLDAGVRIFRFKDAMVHAKTATVDGLWSTVGTANIDRLSLQGNYEINVEVIDRDLAKVLEEIWELDQTNCIELTHGEWEARDLHRRFTELILRPLVRCSEPLRPRRGVTVPIEKPDTTASRPRQSRAVLVGRELAAGDVLRLAEVDELRVDLVAGRVEDLDHPAGDAAQELVRAALAARAEDLQPRLGADHHAGHRRARHVDGDAQLEAVDVARHLAQREQQAVGRDRVEHVGLVGHGRQGASRVSLGTRHVARTSPQAT